MANRAARRAMRGQVRERERAVAMLVEWERLRELPNPTDEEEAEARQLHEALSRHVERIEGSVDPELLAAELASPRRAGEIASDLDGWR